jgi:hypothetical protein
LTPEQWIQVRDWRDRKHPEFDDRKLESEWEKHALYWGARERETRSDWAKSFKGWLLKSKELNKQGGVSTARADPPAFKPDPRPAPRTEEEKAEIAADIEASRKADWRRRARHPKAPETSPPKEEDESA